MRRVLALAAEVDLRIVGEPVDGARRERSGVGDDCVIWRERIADARTEFVESVLGSRNIAVGHRSSRSNEMCGERFEELELLIGGAHGCGAGVPRGLERVGISLQRGADEILDDVPGFLETRRCHRDGGSRLVAGFPVGDRPPRMEVPQNPNPQRPASVCGGAERRLEGPTEQAVEQQPRIGDVAAQRSGNRKITHRPFSHWQRDPAAGFDADDTASGRGNADGPRCVGTGRERQQSSRDGRRCSPTRAACPQPRVAGNGRVPMEEAGRVAGETELGRGSLSERNGAR